MLYHISVIKNGEELAAVSAVSFFSLFQKSKITEIMRFISKTISDRCETERRSSIADGDFVVHVYKHNFAQLMKENVPPDICCVIITDVQYPKEVAHRLIDKICQFGGNGRFKDGMATVEEKDECVRFLADIIKKYQKPSADTMYKMKQDVEETKHILCQAVEKLLQRGEKLEDLIDRTEYLSQNSKTLLKRARKGSRVCPWWPF